MAEIRRMPHINSIRRIWRAVSLAPDASIRELARAAEMSVDTAQRSITVLDHLGYIEQAGPRMCRARRILVPFVEVQR